MIIRNRTDTLSNIGTLPHTYVTPTAIPSGTITLFQQTTAPVGWTKVTTHDNKALRVVSATAGSGGTTSFSTVLTTQVTANSATISSTTVTAAQVPIHTHMSAFTLNVSSGRAYASTAVWTGGSTQGESGPNIPAGGSSHIHSTAGAYNTSLNLAVNYVDLILSSKN